MQAALSVSVTNNEDNICEGMTENMNDKLYLILILLILQVGSIVRTYIIHYQIVLDFTLLANFHS